MDAVLEPDAIWVSTRPVGSFDVLCLALERAQDLALRRIGEVDVTKGETFQSK